jgi:hypothetical protein
MGTTIQSASWNLITNEAGFTTDGVAPADPAAAAVTLSPSDPTVSPASTSPLNYLVRFIRLDGSVVTVNGGQFFALGPQAVVEDRRASPDEISSHINVDPSSPRQCIQDDVISSTRSTRCAREGAGSNRSAKYCVSPATSPSRNSMMLTA